MIKTFGSIYRKIDLSNHLAIKRQAALLGLTDENRDITLDLIDDTHMIIRKRKEDDTVTPQRALKTINPYGRFIIPQSFMQTLNLHKGSLVVIHTLEDGSLMVTLPVYGGVV